MSEPTTSGGGSTRPAREQEHRERAGEIDGERGESSLAATNRTTAELAAVAAAAAGYASEQRTVDGPSSPDVGPDVVFSEDVGLFDGMGEKQYCRLEITRGGRLIVRALGLPGVPRVIDIDTVTAVEWLLRASRV